MNRPRRDDSDPAVSAARYLVDRLAGEGAGPDAGDARDGRVRDEDGSGESTGRSMMEQRAHFVEIQIQQSMRRGDFDGLPGAGKPLENLGAAHDPDWWIRRKIERENLTGLGPPALTLRTENLALDARLDATATETEVRSIIEDFNSRIVQARRQLQGGPPVVTPLRDPEEEVERWRARRDAARIAAEAVRAEAEAAWATMTWRERRRARRGR